MSTAQEKIITEFLKEIKLLQDVSGQLELSDSAYQKIKNDTIERFGEKLAKNHWVDQKTAEFVLWGRLVSQQLEEINQTVITEGRSS